MSKNNEKKNVPAPIHFDGPVKRAAKACASGTLSVIGGTSYYTGMGIARIGVLFITAGEACEDKALELRGDLVTRKLLKE